MATPALLQDKFEGMHRDSSRDQLPKNKVWNMVDYIPDLGAPLRKRGGWSYEGPTLDSLDASATVPKRVFWAAFDIVQVGESSTQLIAWDNNGKLFDLTNSVDRGDTTVPLHTPIFFRDLVIWGSGGAAPKKYGGAGAAADLGGSPPTNGRICAVWKERVLMSGQTGHPSESSIYASAAGNAESWDTTNAVVQTPDTVQGIAPLRSGILVFHPGTVTRILGDTWPSATNIGNMAQSPVFDNIGIYSPTALAVQDEHAYWADASGVYKSDGASLVDLTDKGGIRAYWQTQVASSNSIAVGVWRGYVWISLHFTDSDVDWLLCDIDKKQWFRFSASTLVAENFAVRYGAEDELYFSNRYTKRVGALSSVFSPASGVKNDATGDPVLPELETAYYLFGSQKRDRIRRVYLTYDLRDSGSDNPVLTITHAAKPEATLYDSLGDTDFFTETTSSQRVRRQASKVGRGASFRISQGTGGASSDTRIYALEAEVLGSEASR